MHADLTNAYTPSFGLMGTSRSSCSKATSVPLPTGERLPALWQVQTGVRHARAPRQPAVQPAQQNSGHLVAGRGFLYEEQTRRGVSIKHWEEFEDVADHCTVCHKCLSPCPVKIDFGDVSMNMRNLLRKMGQRSFARCLAGHGSCSTPARGHAVLRKLDWIQLPRAANLGNRVLKVRLARNKPHLPPPSVGKAPSKPR
jgi:ferredoxin